MMMIRFGTCLTPSLERVEGIQYVHFLLSCGAGMRRHCSNLLAVA